MRYQNLLTCNNITLYLTEWLILDSKHKSVTLKKIDLTTSTDLVELDSSLPSFISARTVPLTGTFCAASIIKSTRNLRLNI